MTSVSLLNETAIAAANLERQLSSNGNGTLLAEPSIFTHDGVSYRVVTLDDSSTGSQIMQVVPSTSSASSSPNGKTVFVSSSGQATLDTSLQMRSVPVTIPASNILDNHLSIPATGDSALSAASLFSTSTLDSSPAGQLVQGSGGQLFLMMNTHMPITTSAATEVNLGSKKLAIAGNKISLPPPQLAPSPSRLQVVNGRSGSDGATVVKEDKRRVNHNEVERRRRDKINCYLTELAEMMPAVPNSNGGGSSSPNGHDSAANSRQLASSKGVILERAVNFFRGVMAENAQLRTTTEFLKNQLLQSQQELVALRDKKPPPTAASEDNFDDASVPRKRLRFEATKSSNDTHMNRTLLPLKPRHRVPNDHEVDACDA